MSDNNNLEKNNPSSNEKAEGISEHADSIDAEVAGGDGIDDMKGISKETESLHDRSKKREEEDQEEAERILVRMKEKRASAGEDETPLSSPENKAEGTPKEIFLNSLEEELSQMEKDGTISSERAEDKRKAAASIEEGFTDDPKSDAFAFISAGVFLGKKSETEAEDESAEEAETPKDIFLNSLEEELSQMEKDGTISSERAEDKRKAAASIEEGFTDDPKSDALAFISAGVFFDGESGTEDDSVER